MTMQIHSGESRHVLLLLLQAVTAILCPRSRITAGIIQMCWLGVFRHKWCMSSGQRLAAGDRLSITPLHLHLQRMPACDLCVIMATGDVGVAVGHNWAGAGAAAQCHDGVLRHQEPLRRAPAGLRAGPPVLRSTAPPVKVLPKGAHECLHSHHSLRRASSPDEDPCPPSHSGGYAMMCSALRPSATAHSPLPMDKFDLRPVVRHRLVLAACCVGTQLLLFEAGNPARDDRAAAAAGNAPLPGAGWGAHLQDPAPANPCFT